MNNGLEEIKTLRGFNQVELNNDENVNKSLNIIEKELKILKILKKYIYYSNKSHCFRMREIRKSTQNFDYEDLKEVIGDAIIPKQ